jgi:hypothetical protein
MGLDTKTYWLTDRQSQCDFDFDFDFDFEFSLVSNEESFSSVPYEKKWMQWQF